MNSTLPRLVLDFLRDPFDPVRNALLLSELERYLPDPGLDYPESVDAAVECITLWRQVLPPEVNLPDPEQVRALWPRLGPRARQLVCTHDVDHHGWRCAQDVAGEYELAVLLLLNPDMRVDRLYGTLALSTLPLGMLRSPDGLLAPVAGTARGLWRFLSGER